MRKRKDSQATQNIGANETYARAGRVRRALRSPLTWAALVSFLIHAVMVIVIPGLFLGDPRPKRADALRLWLTEKPTTEEKTPNVDVKRKTVVEFAPLANTQKPKDANHLAEQDSSTEREQRAPLASTGGQSASRDRAQISDEMKTSRATEGVGIRRARKFNKSDPLNIRPHSFDADSPGQASDDFLPEVERGDHTQLNAWQWRHAPFFNRIKARIGQVWSPGTQIARFDPEGVLLGQRDRVTVVKATIDRSGVLQNLKIIDASGVVYLDDEAERAFRIAAPFPYPPQELFKNRDDFSFTFAFHLSIDRGFSLKFDWKEN